MSRTANNRIIIDKAFADQVIPVCCPDGTFDFMLLEPTDSSLIEYCDLCEMKQNSKVYDGDDVASRYEESQREYDYFKFTKGCMVIELLTDLGGVPKSMLMFIANRLKVPFTFLFDSDTDNYWGIETYSIGVDGNVFLSDARYNSSKDLSVCYRISPEEWYEWSQDREAEEFAEEVKKLKAKVAARSLG